MRPTVSPNGDLISDREFRLVLVAFSLSSSLAQYVQHKLTILLLAPFILDTVNSVKWEMLYEDIQYSAGFRFSH